MQIVMLLLENSKLIEAGTPDTLFSLSTCIITFHNVYVIVYVAVVDRDLFKKYILHSSNIMYRKLGRKIQIKLYSSVCVLLLYYIVMF